MSRRSAAIRLPAVAGMFYPAESGALDTMLQRCFDSAVPPVPGAKAPPAIIVPHAGYIYSGPVAASAYLRLEPIRTSVRRVLLLGPCHHVPVMGLALSSADAWETPLGLVPLDTDTVPDLLRLPQVQMDDAAHAPEHSLEVQVPFLQSVLDEFVLLPLAVGAASPDEVAAVIEAVWTDPGTIVVVSTDLSHYHPYAAAVERDTSTAAAITSLRYEAIGDRDACGARPLRGLLKAAADRHLTVEQLDLRNSGDTAGDRSRVVGYGAFAVV
jgi:AmmeMemoRadiSam system protein B